MSLVLCDTSGAVHEWASPYFGHLYNAASWVSSAASKAGDSHKELAQAGAGAVAISEALSEIEGADTEEKQKIKEERAVRKAAEKTEKAERVQRKLQANSAAALEAKKAQKRQKSHAHMKEHENARSRKDKVEESPEKKKERHQLQLLMNKRNEIRKTHDTWNKCDKYKGQTVTVYTFSTQPIVTPKVASDGQEIPGQLAYIPVIEYNKQKPERLEDEIKYVFEDTIPDLLRRPPQCCPFVRHGCVPISSLARIERQP